MLNTARVPHFCPVLWDFGRAGLLPRPGRAEAHFLLHEPQLQRGFGEQENCIRANFGRTERRKKTKRKASKQNKSECNKIIVCIENSTFGIDFFHQTKG